MSGHRAADVQRPRFGRREPAERVLDTGLHDLDADAPRIVAPVEPVVERDRALRMRLRLGDLAHLVIGHRQHRPQRGLGFGLAGEFAADARADVVGELDDAQGDAFVLERPIGAARRGAEEAGDERGDLLGTGALIVGQSRLTQGDGRQRDERQHAGGGQSDADAVAADEPAQVW